MERNHERTDTDGIVKGQQGRSGMQAFDLAEGGLEKYGYPPRQRTTVIDRCL